MRRENEDNEFSLFCKYRITRQPLDTPQLILKCPGSLSGSTQTLRSNEHPRRNFPNNYPDQKRRWIERESENIYVKVDPESVTIHGYLRGEITLYNDQWKRSGENTESVISVIHRVIRPALRSTISSITPELNWLQHPTFVAIFHRWLLPSWSRA